MIDETYLENTIKTAELRRQNQRMRDCAFLMARALEWAADWVCPHHDSKTRLEQNPNIDRDWCSQCSNWVGRNDLVNPIQTALDLYADIFIGQLGHRRKNDRT